MSSHSHYKFSSPGCFSGAGTNLAHRDGWFNAAGHNASGVATMIGVAEYFAKGPQAQRPSATGKELRSG